MYNEHLSPSMITDQAKRICDVLGVCREEAIFYLEAFYWDLEAAMEACRSKTLNLPSLTVDSSPEKEKSSPEAPSQLPMTTDSQSRNEIIVQFYHLAVGSDTQDATSYLERNDWDLERAVLQFLEERRPTSSQRKLARLNPQRYLKDETNATVGTLLETMREEKDHKAIPSLVSSHLKVQESTSLVEGTLSSMSSSQLTNTPEEKLSQWKEESIKSFFKVAIGASREAAIACLSHCKWNQDDAISYFFGDYAEDIQESTSPVKESAEALSSSMSLIKLTDSPDEQLSRLKEEIVKSFCDVVIVASPKAAKACLSHCKWNQEDAVSYFFREYIQANPEIAKSQAVVQESTSSSVKKSAEGTLSSMSSSQLTNTSEEKLSQWKEESIKSFRKAAIGASRVAAIACLRHCNWNQDEAISYFEDCTEATPGTGKAGDEDSSTESVEKAGGGYFPGAKAHVKIQEISSPTQTKEDSRTSSNQLQNFPVQQSQWKDDLIDLLVLEADGVVTRDVATVYLTLGNWNIDQAFSYLMEEEKTTQVQASHGSQDEGYLEDETGSSSSSSNADPTEAGNVTVAVPEDATSQVDEHAKDKDVEEELSPVPIASTTIELKINLAAAGESGTPVWILFRSDQTVRDIRKMIAWFRPEDKRDYYLKSDTGVEYRDVDTTVRSITSGSCGSTTLHQMYST